MTDRELMQQALDALEEAADHIGCPDDDDAIGVTRKALRARLEQLEQEPVAWMEFEGYMDEDGLMSERKVLHTWDNGKGEPLYTAPPQREWQGLTDEEIQEMWSDHCKNWQRAGKILISPTVFGNAIEAKLKEKNT